MTDQKENVSMDLFDDQNSGENEFVFRFPLKPKPICEDPSKVLSVFFKSQLQELLKLVCLFENGRKVIPTEFAFLNETRTLIPLWKDSPQEATKIDEQPIAETYADTM